MSDLLVGLIVGIVLVVFANPFKGLIFIIREQRQQIDFLTANEAREEHGPGASGPETEKA
jgi:hypothetical protein